MFIRPHFVINWSAPRPRLSPPHRRNQTPSQTAQSNNLCTNKSNPRGLAQNLITARNHSAAFAHKAPTQTLRTLDSHGTFECERATESKFMPVFRRPDQSKTILEKLNYHNPPRCRSNQCLYPIQVVQHRNQSSVRFSVVYAGNLISTTQTHKKCAAKTLDFLSTAKQNASVCHRTISNATLNWTWPTMPHTVNQ